MVQGELSEKSMELGKKFGVLVVFAMFCIFYFWCGIAFMVQVACLLLSLSEYATYIRLTVLIATTLPVILAVVKGVRELAKRSEVKEALKVISLEVQKKIPAVAKLSLIVWAILSASLIVYIEVEYSAVVSRYQNIYSSYLKSSRGRGSSWRCAGRYINL